MHPEKERELDERGEDPDNKEETHLGGELAPAEIFQREIIIDPGMHEEGGRDQHRGEKGDHDDVEPVDLKEDQEFFHGTKELVYERFIGKFLS